MVAAQAATPHLVRSPKGNCAGKPEPWSERQVSLTHECRLQALQQALVWYSSLRSNPASAVKPPKVERSKMNTYSLTQTVEMLEAVRGSRVYSPALLD